MSSIPLSRRDFLKLSAAGLFGAGLAEARLGRALAADAPLQGRMTLSGIALYKGPSLNAKKLHVFGRDEVVNILSVVDGDFGPGNPFDSNWYGLEGGYT